MYLHRVESLQPMIEIEIETWSKNRDILKNVEMKIECPEIVLERMRRCKVPEMNKLNDEFL